MKRTFCTITILAVLMASSFAATVYVEPYNMGTNPLPSSGLLRVRVYLQSIPYFEAGVVAINFRNQNGDLMPVTAFTVPRDCRPWDAASYFGADEKYQFGARPPEYDYDEYDNIIGIIEPAVEGLAARYNNTRFSGSALELYVPAEDPIRSLGLLPAGATNITATKTWMLDIFFAYSDVPGGMYTLELDPELSMFADRNGEIPLSSITVVNGTFTIEHYLFVGSTPIKGVPISGDASGITDFSKSLSWGQTVTVSAPAVALDGAVRYDFVRWEIDGEQQPAGQLSAQFTVDHPMTALAVYEIRKHTLTVSSAPVTGIAIAGNLTNHALTVDDQETRELTAPAVASVGGLDYAFIRWVIDGLEQPEGQASVSVLMDRDQTATAVYFRARLSIISSPHSGIYLAGSHWGMTPYEFVFLSPQDVILSAQLWVSRDSVPYNFAYWKINGVVQQPPQTDIQFRVEGDTTVEVVYHRMPGDANEDCYVNILDMIFVRNRLGQDVDTGDNWRADVNWDGRINILDLIFVRNRLGARCQ